MMVKIDTNTWKPFRVGDLFEVKRGKSRIMRELNDGDVPLIAAARAEQGVAGTFDIEFEYADAITVSCNGAGCGSTFYHSGAFAITGDASVLLEKSSMSQLVKMFITSILDGRLSQIYSYAEKCGPAVLSDEVILLPATPDGEPDWAYMEAYMQQVFDREAVFAEHLASLMAEAVADGHVVDTSAWKAFKVGDLFGIAKHGTYVNPRYLSSDADGFAIVSASTKNNGVSDDRYACDESFLIPSGVVTWGKQSPLFAYQTEVTIPGQGVYYYDVTALSKYQALFICSVMQSAVASKYDYQECLIGSKMDDEFVLLPATPDGAPDWAYMERYMRGVMAVEALFADELDRLSRE